MSTDDPNIARVVVTGRNADARSTIVSDGPTGTWTRRPTGAIVMDLWRVDELPVSVDAPNTSTDEVVLQPAEAGLAVRISIMPPDSEIDDEAAANYKASMAAIYGADGNSAGAPTDPPGMHTTETVDVMTVLDGEVWALLEDGETLLRTGDSMIQRGTRHAWSNRSDKPVTVVTTMMTATRPTSDS